MSEIQRRYGTEYSADENTEYGCRCQCSAPANFSAPRTHTPLADVTSQVCVIDRTVTSGSKTTIAVLSGNVLI